MYHKTRIINLFGVLFLIVILNFVFSDFVSSHDTNQIQVKDLELRFFFPNQELEKEEIFLYKPQRISSDKSGHVYISCIGDHRILEFDAEGKFINSIGRAGQGPGEFKGPQSRISLEG